jgi:tetrahydromethanopterin S-methyltransferase subunit F
VGQVHAVRYRCDYYGRCYRTGIRGGAIAGIIIGKIFSSSVYHADIDSCVI